MPAAARLSRPWLDHRIRPTLHPGNLALRFSHLLQRTRRTPLPSLFSCRTLVVLFAFYLSALCTYNYYRRVEAPALDQRLALHTAIVSGTAPYQFRYRVLVPFAVDILAKALDGDAAEGAPSAPQSPFRFSRRAFALAYAGSNFLALLIFFVSLAALVKQLLGLQFSFIAMLLSAIVIDFTFRDHYFHPWSFWEGALYASGLLLVQKRRYWLFIGLTTLGALNRETSVFLLLGFFFYGLPRPLHASVFRFTAVFRNAAIRCAFLGIVLWLIAFFLTHQLVGYSPATHTAEMAWQNNRAQLYYTLLLNGLLFGPLWILLPYGLLHSPVLVQRFALMIPFYFIPLLYLGHWWEVRYWISLLPILVSAFVVSIARLCGWPTLMSSGNKTLLGS